MVWDVIWCYFERPKKGHYIWPDVGNLHLDLTFFCRCKIKSVAWKCALCSGLLGNMHSVHSFSLGSEQVDRGKKAVSDCRIYEKLKKEPQATRGT